MTETRPRTSFAPWSVRLALGASITVAAVLSQYLVPSDWPGARLLYGSLVGDLAVVYGLPIAALALLLGADPLRNWRARSRSAIPLGLGWYCALSLLALVVTIALVIVYEIVDPAALGPLSRENPALRSAAGDPWFYVALSFLVGACEETIFRGWIFGTWARNAHGWIVPAIVTSGLFAGVHVYYGLTFGLASPFYYQELFLLGFAFAATYQATGGNLLVIALLHGLNDAIAFTSLVSQDVEIAAHYLLIVGGAIVGLVYYLRTRPAPPLPLVP